MIHFLALLYSLLYSARSEAKAAVSWGIARIHAKLGLGKVKGADKRYMDSELKSWAGAEGSAAQPRLHKLALPRHGSTPSR